LSNRHFNPRGLKPTGEKACAGRVAGKDGGRRMKGVLVPALILHPSAFILSLVRQVAAGEEDEADAGPQRVELSDAPVVFADGLLELRELVLLSDDGER
jgi:hypothetical protein